MDIGETILVRATVGLLCVFISSFAFAKDKQQFLTDPLAVAFGSAPEIWGARLSPDGSKISFLSVNKKADLPVLVIFDFNTGKLKAVLSSAEGKADINWCEWANNERLLCGYYGVEWVAHSLVPFTRLVGINADGSKMKVLLQNKLKYEWSQFQANVIDWLPDDSHHVLAQVPVDTSTGVAKLDIYSGSTELEARLRENARKYKTDGRGEIRFYYYMSDNKEKWFYRLSGESTFKELVGGDVKEDLNFYPIGFGDNLNQVYVFKPHEGRTSLWLEDLSRSRESTLVYSHPDVDLDDIEYRGKYRRPVAVSYETDKPHLHYFDASFENIAKRIEPLFPDKLISVVDESWDQQYFIVQVSSDTDPGNYYRFSVAKKRMEKLFLPYPLLANRTLATMQAITYKARDGVDIPGYLTLPPGKEAKNLPLVVMPHGGPQSRDSWGFNFISQFMAAKGYAVLQMNYRGSGGYGEDWAGEGGFKAWRQVMSDIEDGVNALIADGTVDPDHLCIAGWSYGGYAALMSGAEYPGKYRCIVSIAGVTDPQTLVRDARKYIGGRSTRALVGYDDEVLAEGSPVKRSVDIQAPVLLFHGDHDLNVYMKHSEKMADALAEAGKEVEFIRYEDADHGIDRNKYRIDLLSRLGAFLDSHIGPGAVPQMAATKP